MTMVAPGWVGKVVALAGHVVVVVDGFGVAIVLVDVESDVVVGGATEVDVDVVGCAPGSSGDTHPDGGAVGTGSPGVTVPAQPISESMLSLVTDPPLAKVAAVFVSRMNPRASTETTSVVPK